MTARRRKRHVTRESTAEQETRNQEVLRANRELAAYFKGRRTEREARAALKTIKAFVRDRERRDATNRPPLPGVVAVRAQTELPERKAGSAHGNKPRRPSRGKPQAKRSRRPTSSIGPNLQSPQLSESDKQTSE
jgi:beta-phosphoglucomutase-like phosphatase (HAD superfamily)